MKKILIVEDSKLFSKLLAKRIVRDFQTECVICTTYKETALKDSLDEMVQKADELLYQAKESGRNCVIIEQ